MDIKEYKIGGIKGVTDLEEILGDFETEYWTKDDWYKWETDAPNREKRDQDYINKLKEEGEYGKPSEININFVVHPLFNDPKITSNSKTFFNHTLLDFSKPKNI